MMGFAGQLSLGHALYVGLGAYAAAALYVHFGIESWSGCGPRSRRCRRRRRHRLSGVPLRGCRRLLRHPDHCVCRIRAASASTTGWVGGSAGFFLPSPTMRERPLNLRGSPTMFYYVMLAMTVAAFLLAMRCCRAAWAITGRRSARTRRPPRRSASTCSATRCIAVVLSAAMTSFARRVFRLLLQQSVSRAGVPHLALDRADPRADHRRHRHAVRPDRRRVPADRAGRGPDAIMRRSASMSPASNRCFMASACCSS